MRSWSKDVTAEEATALYREFYREEPFVRICRAGQFPNLSSVVGSNYCDIGVTVDKRTGTDHHRLGDRQPDQGGFRSGDPEHESDVRSQGRNRFARHSPFPLTCRRSDVSENIQHPDEEKRGIHSPSRGEGRHLCCGITAYDVCHVGHARSAVVFDVITRYLRYRGYDVTYVKNFTDVDDKIIEKAQPGEERDRRDRRAVYPGAR